MVSQALPSLERKRRGDGKGADLEKEKWGRTVKEGRKGGLLRARGEVRSDETKKSGRAGKDKAPGCGRTSTT